jgi:hypothetical protein
MFFCSKSRSVKDLNLYLQYSKIISTSEHGGECVRGCPIGGEYGSTLGGVSFTAKGTSIFHTSFFLLCLSAIVLCVFSLRPLQELFEYLWSLNPDLSISLGKILKKHEFF